MTGKVKGKLKTFFMIKNEKPFTIEKFVNGLKTIVQWVIGAYIIYFTLCTFIPILFFHAQYDQSFLKTISICLLASSAIELGYMLFTPGPDEAIVPVITGIAASILMILSNSSVLDLDDSLSLGILVVAIGCLFWVKEKYLRDKNQ